MAERLRFLKKNPSDTGSFGTQYPAATHCCVVPSLYAPAAPLDVQSNSSILLSCPLLS